MAQVASMISPAARVRKPAADSCQLKDALPLDFLAESSNDNTIPPRCDPPTCKPSYWEHTSQNYNPVLADLCCNLVLSVSRPPVGTATGTAMARRFQTSEHHPSPSIRSELFRRCSHGVSSPWRAVSVDWRIAQAAPACRRQRAALALDGDGRWRRAGLLNSALP